jgi:hypothetical protein
MGFEARPPPSFGQVGCMCGSHLFSKNTEIFVHILPEIIVKLELKTCVLFYIIEPKPLQLIVHNQHFWFSLTQCITWGVIVVGLIGFIVM